jgi:hypothetical protein
MRSAGASDEEARAALEFDPDRIALTQKEKALFNYALKANGDPHAIQPADIAELRRGSCFSTFTPEAASSAAA